MAWYGQKHLKHVGNLVVDKRSSDEKGDTQNLLFAIFKHSNSIIGFAITVLIGLGIWFIGESWSYGLLVIGLAFAVGVGIVVYNDGNKIEKDRILVTYLSFLIIIIFWGAFEQAGGLLNVYTYQKTDLSLGDFMVPRQ